MSRNNNNYIIPLQSLEDGIHEISLKIDKTFIEIQKIEDMLDINVTVSIRFTKRPQVHSLDLHIKGNVVIPCDRCLEPLKIPISSSQTMVVKVANASDELSDLEDVILLSRDQKEIDLSHIIYENILLSLPLKKTHKEIECNAFMTSFLESKEQKTKEQTNDPRWDSLKNIFKN